MVGAPFWYEQPGEILRVVRTLLKDEAAQEEFIFLREFLSEHRQDILTGLQRKPNAAATQAWNDFVAELCADEQTRLDGLILKARGGGSAAEFPEGRRALAEQE